MWLAIALVIVVLSILQYYYNSIRALFLMRKVNGPTPLPIIGNALYFYNKTAAEIFVNAVNLARGYGIFTKFWLGSELKILIQDTKDIEIILSSVRYIDKASDYNFFKPWLNEGLLLSTGKKWHDRRKVITPAFHFKMLEKFVETFDRLGDTFIEKLNDHDANKPIELYPIIGLLALDVVCETAMGVRINALSRPDSEYVKAVKEITHVIHIRMFDFALRNQFLFKYSKQFINEAYALRVLHGFTDDVIRKRRKELTECINNSEEIIDDINIQKSRALLDLLLHSTIDGKPLTDHDIREENDTFMFEGHDTTTSGITFCLYNIAKHPEVQKKCFNEITRVFGTDAKQPSTFVSLNQLTYLELTIKETLRLFPSVPCVARTAMEDFALTNNRVIPRGATVIVPIYPLGRNPIYFKDPEEFRPERFLDEQIMEKKNLFAYIPFSAGPRNCIGQKFAMYELKCIVSKVLRNFEISLTKDSEVEPTLSGALVLRPENEIKFHLKRRI